jgi:pimeloyl-ACP methyl ester carboxylesterase
VPYIDREGVRIHYEVAGTSTGRPPLLLTHGYSATAEMWTVNLPALSKHRPVITWDIRGHGLSDSPDDPAAYSEAASVDDMAAILDAVEVPRAVIGGLSLGGYLSLAFHLRYRERVVGLILCDTGPGYRRDEPRGAWNTQTERFAAAFDKRGLDALGAGAEIRASTQRSPSGLARAARGILAQHDARVIDSLPTIAVPTLVLVGETDKPFLAATDAMAAKIPGAAKAVIANAGHASNIDQPDAFDEVVGGFLDTI